MNRHYAQHSETSDKNLQGKIENISASAASNAAKETQSGDELKDAVEDLKDDRCIDRQEEVNPGQCPSTKKGQGKWNDNKLKAAFDDEDQRMNDDTGEPRQKKKSEPEITVNPLQMDGNKEKPLCDSSEEERKTLAKETEKVFKKLQLHDKSQAKLSPAGFLQIGPPVKQSNDMSEKDLAQAFLQSLMMLDYRARYNPVQQESPDPSNLKAAQGLENEDTDDDNCDYLFSTNMGAELSKDNHVHPMDVQMAIFHCSDSFLRQKMITKLSQCQYADRKSVV